MQRRYLRGQNDGDIQPDRDVRQKSKALQRPDLTEDETNQREYDLCNDN